MTSTCIFRAYAARHAEDAGDGGRAYGESVRMTWGQQGTAKGRQDEPLSVFSKRTATTASSIMLLAIISVHHTNPQLIPFHIPTHRSNGHEETKGSCRSSHVLAKRGQRTTRTRSATKVSTLRGASDGRPLCQRKVKPTSRRDLGRVFLFMLTGGWQTTPTVSKPTQLNSRR